jgi:hypothetical protein
MLTSYAAAHEDIVGHKTQNERRRRGGQIGNENALRTGQHTKAATDARKASFAVMKALAHVIAANGLTPHRIRPCALRHDQWCLLLVRAPEIAEIMRPLLPRGFFVADSFTHRMESRANNKSM